ncbi:hypothetical protein HBI23_132430 [Parastagonospora nodorum]|nr:hypothetical protein HBH51_230330 [Parastagonospora nodorum]KAH5397999.1 hypothetical protein HBI47_208760 [Parastagonospora nodorum]KAH5658499.1 hypothetical protein HBI23_132430 [Parastagonospora nodorum]KAH5730810.1 hypothetical protein HBI17_219860 [Parastagonospora nodorum]KAH6045262.1 hypothetical protein HBI67_241360 [Parastagonospora nodorum]
MTRLTPILLSALLSALTTSVGAKSKGDQVRLYQWTSDKCNDMPKGGNIDVKRNECVNIEGRSFRPKIDTKRQKWLDEVNDGNLQCALVIFDQSNCPEQDQADSIMYLPHDIDECYTSPTTYSVGSVKFLCAPATVNHNVTSTYTSTSTATSWSIGSDDQVTPVTHTSTLYSTSTISKVASASMDISARAAEVRKKENVVSVWMKHPWSGSTVCYECYTKKSNDLGWVKCKARLNEAHMCGPRPDENPGDKPATTTTTATTSTTTTVTQSTLRPGTQIETTTVKAPGAQPSLQARSWHKKVAFRSPWQKDQRYCADAEWEKRGKPNTEIRLQKVHLAKSKDDCASNESIDLPQAPEPILETATGTDILTDTVTATGYTAKATVTKTIYTAIVVSTVTVSEAEGAAMPSTTYWPTQFTLTTLTSTSFTITTLVPQETVATKYMGAALADDRANVPVHRDL